MSVLFVIPHLGNGGAERDVVTISNGLVEAGVEVGILTFQGGGDYQADLNPAVELYTVGRRVKTFDDRLRALPHIIKAGRRYKTIVSVLELATDEVVIWAKRAFDSVGMRKRYVGMVHIALSHFEHYETHPRRKKMVKNCYPLFDCIIGVSKGVAEDISMILGDRSTRIEGIFNPVDIDKIRRNSMEETDLARYKPFFLAVGRISPQKDYATLIRGFHEFTRGKHPEHHLIILGRGEDQGLADLCSELSVPNVHFLGFSHNPWMFMKNSAALVLSSICEGMSLVIAEAMVCGIPVISTDCPYGPAELLENGKNGYLVPMSDPHALASAMQYLVEHPEETAAKAENASESGVRFHSSTIIPRYIELLTPWRAEGAQDMESINPKTGAARNAS